MHHPDDTIAAPATAPGESALAVLRVSGPEALAAFESLVASDSAPGEWIPRHLHHIRLVDADGHPLDEVMAAWMPGPRSYTGEDLVEISTHGGPDTVRAVLAALYRQGVVAARPGEFTYRAFLNGRLDLMQAEAVAELIHSRGEQERRLALHQLEGSLSRRVDPLRLRLLDLLRDLEAGIDFVEEDIEFVSTDDLDAALCRVREDLSRLRASASDGILLREGVSVVLAGLPNTGKSSLFNALLGAERAIVTEEPGTTRDLLRESWVEGGLLFRLEDTAGLREARAEAERIGVARSEDAVARAQITLWVCDGSRAPEAEERERLARLDPSRDLVLVNKSDLSRYDATPYREILSSATELLELSAHAGSGLDALKSRLFELATGRRAGEAIELEFAVNRRQESRLAAAAAALEELSAEGLAALEPELVARQLREALAALDELSGRQVSERVLDEIFRNFCIGK